MSENNGNLDPKVTGIIENAQIVSKIQARNNEKQKSGVGRG